MAAVCDRELSYLSWIFMDGQETRNNTRRDTVETPLSSLRCKRLSVGIAESTTNHQPRQYASTINNQAFEIRQTQKLSHRSTKLLFIIPCVLVRALTFSYSHMVSVFGSFELRTGHSANRHLPIFSIVWSVEGSDRDPEWQLF